MEPLERLQFEEILTRLCADTSKLPYIPMIHWKIALFNCLTYEQYVIYLIGRQTDRHENSEHFPEI